MVDANQIWNVNESIEWMKNLADFKLWWIEEPTSPDDALGHAKIASALRPLGIITFNSSIYSKNHFSLFSQ